MLLRFALLCVAVAIAAPVESDARFPASTLSPLVGEPMLICDGGNLQSCQMRCTMRFKQCHRGDPSRMEQCRTEVLEPCNQACDEQCG